MSPPCIILRASRRLSQTTTKTTNLTCSTTTISSLSSSISSTPAIHYNRQLFQTKQPYSSLICHLANNATSPLSPPGVMTHRSFSDNSSPNNAKTEDQHETTTTTTVSAAETPSQTPTTTDEYNKLIATHLTNSNVTLAATLLDKMSLSPSTLPTNETYTLLLSHYTSHPHRRGYPSRAQSLLAAMPHPTPLHRKSVLRCWTSSAEHLFASRAQDAFDALPTTERDGECYEWMIRAWCRSKERGGVFKATRLLEEMERVDDRGMAATVGVYKVVLEGWARRKGFSWRGEGVLWRMEDSYRKSSDGGEEETRRSGVVKPDEECYKLVLRGLATEEVLYRDNNNGDGNGTDATSTGERAEALLKRMRDLMLIPDADCFGYAIRALSRCCDDNHFDYAERADALLTEMEDMHRRGVLSPTPDHYRDVMVAYAACGNKKSGYKAQDVFDRFVRYAEERRVKSEGKVVIPVDAGMIAAVIRAWIASPSLNKISRTRKLLGKLQSKDDVFDKDDTVAAYNAFVQVCTNMHPRATPSEKREALRSAIRAVADLKPRKKKAKNGSSGSNNNNNNTPTPDNITYRLLLTACIKLLPDDHERARTLMGVFRNACRDGCVDGEVVTLVADHVSPATYRRGLAAMGCHDASLLPPAWSANVTVRSADGFWAKIGVDGKLVVDDGQRDARMERLRRRTNQKLLRGGRVGS